ncbi:hypothetical protein FBQ96_13480 [Nitrospirales bacterium NOB]|nr:hypothetical protein [Nitrospira sp. NTP2]MDL1890565.1 hypothetical protein [Nitrospirales bacterium NOB]QOJ35206.1 MAG: Fic family protein [Nitrospira sp.]RIK57977.1 MAG: hypothetical protein DCC63_12480 [Nitrospira sp.]
MEVLFLILWNHPFIDGNKRIRFVVAILFLELNSSRMRASEGDAAKPFCCQAGSFHCRITDSPRWPAPLI